MAQPSNTHAVAEQSPAQGHKDLDVLLAELSAKEKALEGQATAVEQSKLQIQLQLQQLQQQHQALAAREARVAAAEADLQRRHAALASERQAMARDLQVAQKHANDLQHLQQAIEQRYAVMLHLARQVTGAMKAHSAGAAAGQPLQPLVNSSPPQPLSPPLKLPQENIPPLPHSSSTVASLLDSLSTAAQTFGLCDLNETCGIDALNAPLAQLKTSLPNTSTYVDLNIESNGVPVGGAVHESGLPTAGSNNHSVWGGLNVAAPTAAPTPVTATSNIPACDSIVNQTFQSNMSANTQCAEFQGLGMSSAPAVPPAHMTHMPPACEGLQHDPAVAAGHACVEEGRPSASHSSHMPHIVLGSQQVPAVPLSSSPPASARLQHDGPSAAWAAQSTRFETSPGAVQQASNTSAALHPSLQVNPDSHPTAICDRFEAAALHPSFGVTANGCSANSSGPVEHDASHNGSIRKAQTEHNAPDGRVKDGRIDVAGARSNAVTGVWDGGDVDRSMINEERPTKKIKIEDRDCIREECVNNEHGIDWHVHECKKVVMDQEGRERSQSHQDGREFDDGKRRSKEQGRDSRPNGDPAQHKIDQQRSQQTERVGKSSKEQARSDHDQRRSHEEKRESKTVKDRPQHEHGERWPHEDKRESKSHKERSEHRSHSRSSGSHSQHASHSTRPGKRDRELLRQEEKRKLKEAKREEEMREKKRLKRQAQRQRRHEREQQLIKQQQNSGDLLLQAEEAQRDQTMNGANHNEATPDGAGECLNAGQYTTGEEGRHMDALQSVAREQPPAVQETHVPAVAQNSASMPVDNTRTGSFMEAVEVEGTNGTAGTGAGLSLVGTGTNCHAVTGTHANRHSGTGIGSHATNGIGIGSHATDGTGIGSHATNGTGTGSHATNGTGTRSHATNGTGTGSHAGTSTSASIGPIAGIGLGVGSIAGIGMSVGPIAGIGMGVGTIASSVMGLGTGIGLGMGTGIGMGMGAGMGISGGTNAGITTHAHAGGGFHDGAGTGSSLGGAGLAAGASNAVDIPESASNHAIAVNGAGAVGVTGGRACESNVHGAVTSPVTGTGVGVATGAQFIEASGAMQHPTGVTVGDSLNSSEPQQHPPAGYAARHTTSHVPVDNPPTPTTMVGAGRHVVGQTATSPGTGNVQTALFSGSLMSPARHAVSDPAVPHPGTGHVPPAPATSSLTSPARHSGVDHSMPSPGSGNAHPASPSVAHPQAPNGLPPILMVYPSSHLPPSPAPIPGQHPTSNWPDRHHPGWQQPSRSPPVRHNLSAGQGDDGRQYRGYPDQNHGYHTVWSAAGHRMGSAHDAHHASHSIHGPPHYQRMPPPGYDPDRSEDRYRHNDSYHAGPGQPPNAQGRGHPTHRGGHHLGGGTRFRPTVFTHTPFPTTHAGHANDTAPAADVDSREPQGGHGVHGDVPAYSMNNRPPTARGRGITKGGRVFRAQPNVVPRHAPGNGDSTAGASTVGAKTGSVIYRKTFTPNLTRKRRGGHAGPGHRTGGSDHGIDEIVALLQQDAAEEAGGSATDGCDDPDVEIVSDQ